MRIHAIRIKLLHPRDDLITAIQKSIKRIPEKSILAITSKVVSLSEGRWVAKTRGVTMEKLVRQEGKRVWKSKHCFLALRGGQLLPNAGIDESNAFGGYVLLPRNPFVSAERIGKALKRHYKLKRLGVLITDSWPMPLRRGVVGVALGYAGFQGIKNYIGSKDLFGRRMRISSVSVADTLASAAVLAMGEGSEQTPIALIENAPVKFVSQVNEKELHIPAGEDVYKEVMKL